MRCLHLLVLLLLPEPSQQLEQNETTITRNETIPQRLSRLKAYWKQTLAEISNSTMPERKKQTTTQWKSLMEKSPRRFEGFASWDRLLQQWAEDVADYLETQENEAGGYPMSTYGQPMMEKEEVQEDKPLKHQLLVEDDQADEEEEAKINKSHQLLVEDIKEKLLVPQQTHAKLPIPAPALPGEPVLPHTDLRDSTKKIWIVTTAALPWMTGTAVNPLLRAAHLCKGRDPRQVTLHLPWLERQSDQVRVYQNQTFATPEDQELYIRNWLLHEAEMPDASRDLRIEWYTAWQQRAENSLYSMGDITATIPQDDVDIIILEEPEHLNWYRAPGESWTIKFPHVVGIIHTNYFYYAQEQPAALIRAPSMKLLCSWMCRAHCSRVIKLSGTLGQFCPEKELVENVHGVRSSFSKVGTTPNLYQTHDDVFAPNAPPTVYFIGKMLWSKGLNSLMELLKYAQESADLNINLDMYGGGPNAAAAETKSARLGLNWTFYGPTDHANLAYSHKVFVNPSTSEVLCTTVAEALAMGKFVVLPSHPSNDFFAQFPNCLPYTTKEEFVGNLYYALTHSPEPLTEEYAHALSWEAATERLQAAACISVKEAEAKSKALSSAGVEINLPPLIEDEEARKAISTTLHRSRSRYRQFRSRLSQEIQQSNVLPKDLQKRLVAELETRLDVDIDRILDSPTLRLQLSPAELDKVLLEFYNQVTVGPSGDLLRMIGGGTDVGRQDLYLKRQARRLRRQQRASNVTFLDETWKDDAQPETIGALVKRALQRNLPKSPTFATTKRKQGHAGSSSSLGSKRSGNPPQMSTLPLQRQQDRITGIRVPMGVPKHAFLSSHRRPQLYLPLI